MDVMTQLQQQSDEMSRSNNEASKRSTSSTVIPSSSSTATTSATLSTKTAAGPSSKPPTTSKKSATFSINGEGGHKKKTDNGDNDFDPMQVTLTQPNKAVFSKNETNFNAAITNMGITYKMKRSKG